MNLLLQTMASQKSMPKTQVLLIENGTNENENLKVTLESRGLLVRTIGLDQNEIKSPKNLDVDIIILDSGNVPLEFTETLQTIRKICPAPILVLSTINQPNVVAKTLDCGADDFLTKPYSIDVLVASIKKLTRRYHTNTLSDPEKR
jgi:two-component system, OmpR family, KDP operon response regulator KdpE